MTSLAEKESSKSPSSPDLRCTPVHPKATIRRLQRTDEQNKKLTFVRVPQERHWSGRATRYLERLNGKGSPTQAPRDPLCDVSPSVPMAVRR